MERRDFLRACGAGCAGLAAGLFTTASSPGTLTGTLSRPGMQLGHVLRDRKLGDAAVREREQVPLLIVGGGMSGLSAAYYLSKAGFNDYLLLEMEESFGGNATYGQSRISRYPWGAHYLPIPSKESMHVRQMLHDFGMLLDGIDSETPSYDDRYLVHDPQERVFDGAVWREGLFPEEGLAQWEKDEYKRFGEAMEQFRGAYGVDGRKAFAMPVALSSYDPRYRQLDRLTMKGWLDSAGFKGARLLWYVNHCCRDDFGTEIDRASAWICIHYFASRAGKGRHAEQGAFLTWPEGLGRMVAELQQRCGGRHERGFVYRLVGDAKGVRALSYSPETRQNREILAEKIIWAAPARLAKYVVSNDLLPERNALEIKSAPWVVANLELKDWPKYTPEVSLSWDNVIMGARGLGYVVATHQSVTQATHGPTILTCYDTWSHGGNFSFNRQMLEKASWAKLSNRMLSDLRIPHPDIDRLATRMDIRVLGHAMASPEQGFLSHLARKLSRLDGRFLFAHTDAVGYSVFEEASWLGMMAARKALLHG